MLTDYLAALFYCNNRSNEHCLQSLFGKYNFLFCLWKRHTGFVTFSLFSVWTLNGYILKVDLIYRLELAVHYVDRSVAFVFRRLSPSLLRLYILKMRSVRHKLELIVGVVNALWQIIAYQAAVRSLISIRASASPITIIAISTNGLLREVWRYGDVAELWLVHDIQSGFW